MLGSIRRSDPGRSTSPSASPARRFQRHRPQARGEPPCHRRIAGLSPAPRPTQEPSDLFQHNCSSAFSRSKQFRWTLETPEGARQTLRVSGEVDPTMARCCAMVLAGHGLALKAWEIADDLNAGRLRELLLPDHPPPGGPIHALYPRNRFLSRGCGCSSTVRGDLRAGAALGEGVEDKLPEARVGARAVISPVVTSALAPSFQRHGRGRPTIHEFADS